VDIQTYSIVFKNCIALLTKKLLASYLKRKEDVSFNLDFYWYYLYFIFLYISEIIVQNNVHTIMVMIFKVYEKNVC